MRALRKASGVFAESGELLSADAVALKVAQTSDVTARYFRGSIMMFISVELVSHEGSIPSQITDADEMMV